MTDAAELVEGLRAAADFVERHPDMAPRDVLLVKAFMDDAEYLSAVGRLQGVRKDYSPDRIGHERKFGPVTLRLIITVTEWLDQQNALADRDAS